MKTDDRDTRLGQELDRPVRSLEPTAESRLGAIRRRGAHRRAIRWTAISSALAVFIGAIASAGLAIRSSNHQPTASPTVKYSDPANGWSFEYPRQWKVQSFSRHCTLPNGDLLPNGILITNLHNRFRHLTDPNACGAWSFTGLPERMVLIQIEHQPFPRPGKPETRFPLSYDSMSEPSIPAFPGEHPSFAIGDERILNVIQGGRSTYQLTVWLGTGISGHDMRLLRQVIASIGLETTSPSPAPSPSALVTGCPGQSPFISPVPLAPHDCLSPSPTPTGPGGLPLVRVRPQSGPIGTRVELRGRGFTGYLRGLMNSEGGRGVSFSRDYPNGCELIGAGRGHIHVDEQGP